MPNLVAELSQLEVEQLEVVTNSRQFALEPDLESVTAGDLLAKVSQAQTPDIPINSCYCLCCCYECRS